MKLLPASASQKAYSLLHTFGIKITAMMMVGIRTDLAVITQNTVSISSGLLIINTIKNAVNPACRVTVKINVRCKAMPSALKSFRFSGIFEFLYAKNDSARIRNTMYNSALLFQAASCSEEQYVMLIKLKFLISCREEGSRALLDIYFISRFNFYMC